MFYKCNQTLQFYQQKCTLVKKIDITLLKKSKKNVILKKNYNMSRTIIVLFFCVVYLNDLFAQEHISIHQRQLEYYSQFNAQTPEEWAAIRGEAKPNGRSSNKSCTLNKIVFGWHPYWSNGLETNYDWSLLSDLSYFCYTVDPSTGNATTTNSWSTANVVTQALAHGVRVNLCVTLFSDHATFLGSSTAKQTLINNLISLIQARGANGVNIDFEGLPSAQKTNFTNFMIDLCNAFHTQIPGSQVSVCLYAVDWSSVFDIATLKNYVDLFCIMGYDYYYSGSSTAGPSSPLYSLTNSYNYNVSKSITYYLSAGVPNNKLVLGLPYYGEEWSTSSSSVPSSTTSTGSAKFYNTVRNNASGYYTAANKHFNDNSYVPYYAYNNGTTWKQCWIDDAYSLGKKMELVWKRGIAGIGIWALGYDDGYPDLWNKIEEKLTTCFTNACTDTIFDMGGPYLNYYDKESYAYTIQPANAISVTLDFQSFETEAGYDTLWLYDGSSTNAPLIGAYTGTNSPGTVTTTQPAITVRFKSDNATNKPGWTAIWHCNIDNVLPTTSISTPGNWKTQDFTATFNDNDNIGIEKSFYQVLDFDGQYWGANTNRGFFGDNFDIMQPHWNIFAGTWNVSNGELIQSDETATNSNIYAALNQTLSNRYLYHFKAKVSGSGTNKRYGFHFFCDDANYTNRHNSYFVWFRVEDQQLQFYKVVNDTFSLKNTIYNIITNVNQWYDFKITYDRITGEMSVWRDDVFLGTWTDPAPYSTNGNYISFRTGNSAMNITELKVYRSRAASTNITLSNNTNDIRYQNTNPSTPSAKVKSIVVDVNHNLSTIAYEDLNVDWTTPEFSSIIADGLSTDIDTITTANHISGNWQAFTDPNSGIYQYLYSVGTQPGDNSIIDWTNIGANTYFSANANLYMGTTYYINVKAINNAGLTSAVYSSDGAIYLPNGNLPYAQFTSSSTQACSGEVIQYTNQSLSADSVHWIFNGATPSSSNQPNPQVIYNTGGTYHVTLIAYNANGTDTLSLSNYITIWQTPIISIQTNVIGSQAPYYVVFNNQSQFVDNSLWNFGDGLNSTDFAPYHMYAQDGSYIYTYTASNAHCTASYSDTIMLGNSGIYHNENEYILVYPNPAHQYLKLKTENVIIDELSISGLDGKEYLHQTINNSITNVNIDFLENGIYLLSIQLNDHRKLFYKFIKL